MNFPLIFIRWVVSQVFYLCNRAFWLAHHQKKTKTWKTSPMKMECFPFASPFWWKKRALGKEYEIKWNVIGNTLEDHIGNLENVMETHWKPWEHKNKEIPSSHLTPKRKNNWIYSDACWMISLITCILYL